MINEVYVAWQDEQKRSWHTIARLRRNASHYELCITKGAEKLDDVTKKLFKLHTGDKYLFDELIPFFRNKIPSKSRPDFVKMAEWLDVSPLDSEINLLGAFGLIATSDSTLVYPSPQVDDDIYKLSFFVHGIRHRSETAIKLTESLSSGTRLLPMLDVKNPDDPSAVALRVENTEMIIIGYVPAFYSNDLKRLLSDEGVAKNAHIVVKRNNQDGPIQLRLLCHFQCPVPPNFKALDTDAHRIVTKKMVLSGDLTADINRPTAC